MNGVQEAYTCRAQSSRKRKPIKDMFLEPAKDLWLNKPKQLAPCFVIFETEVVYHLNKKCLYALYVDKIQFQLCLRGCSSNSWSHFSPPETPPPPSKNPAHSNKVGHCHHIWSLENVLYMKMGFHPGKITGRLKKNEKSEISINVHIYLFLCGQA